MSKEDTTRWEQLEAARNKEFRALKLDDYVRDVKAAQEMVGKYQRGSP